MEEVIFKVTKPGRKEEKVPKGRGISRYRALKVRELYNPGTENGPIRLFVPPERRRAATEGRRRVLKGCVHHVKELGLHPESNGASQSILMG